MGVKIINKQFQQEIVKNDSNIYVQDDFEPLIRKPKHGNKWIWVDFIGGEYQEVSEYIYNKLTQEKREVQTLQDLGLGGWTIKIPKYQYSIWNEDIGDWIQNKQAQYEAQVQQVDATRRSLYLNVDALRNEAAMIRMLSTDETKVADEAKAADYERQAKDLYMKIRDENPWPTPPTE